MRRYTRREQCTILRAKHEWLIKHPDKCSRILHNLLLNDPELGRMVRVLAGLFAVPPPSGKGVYSRHG